MEASYSDSCGASAEGKQEHCDVNHIQVRGLPLVSCAKWKNW